jgi:hypothetical protein
MKRIAKRIAGSFFYCVLAWGAVSACASEEATFRQDAGKCDPVFCHNLDMIRGCCLNNGACGVDLGNGCVPAKKDSGP